MSMVGEVGAKPQKAPKRLGVMKGILGIVEIFLGVCLVFAIILVVTTPLLPGLLNESNPFVDAKEQRAFFRDWGPACCTGSYALYADGTELIRVGSAVGWVFGNPFSLKLESPYYYQKDHALCRIIFTRESLLEPFQKHCDPVLSSTEEIDSTFMEGRQHVAIDGANVKAMYERYKQFGLVQ